MFLVCFLHVSFGFGLTLLCILVQKLRLPVRGEYDLKRKLEAIVPKAQNVLLAQTGLEPWEFRVKFIQIYAAYTLVEIRATIRSDFEEINLRSGFE